MQVALILTVGLNSSLLSARNLILQGAGYITVSAFSIKEAVDRFLGGDFDLVLLDSTLPAKDKDRLTCLIRASGSRTPVVSVADQQSGEDSFADATIGTNPDKLRAGVRSALTNAMKRAAVSTPFDREKERTADTLCLTSSKVDIL
jgi:CheY-like chemotaxis protein